MNKLSITILIMLLFNIAMPVIIKAQDQNELNLNRTINVYPGFLLIKDVIQIKGYFSNLTIFLSYDEYAALYNIYTDKKFAIQWGQLKGDYIGFTIPINGFQGNLTLTRIYNDKIFLEERGGVKVEIPAYLVTDYSIKNSTVKVEFEYPVSNINYTSPKGISQGFNEGKSFLKYTGTNLTAFNTTLLSFSFNPSPQTPWIKIEKLSRNIIIDNLDYITVEDRFLLLYIGRGQNITEWTPYILPNATVISVRDDLGNLTYSNGVVQLRYPLLSAVYPGATINQTRATVIITSKINIASIGRVEGNKGFIQISMNALASNNLFIDDFELIITAKFFNNIDINPTPYASKKIQDGNSYFFYLNKIDPNREFTIEIKGSINPYVTSVYSVSQVITILLILLILILFYVRFFGITKPKPVLKITEMPRFINLVENLILNNEELKKLDEQLEKGLIKKRDYDYRVSILKREIMNNEEEMRKISLLLTNKYPELKQIIGNLNDAYNELIKTKNTLKELKDAYKLKKVQPAVYRKTLEIYNKKMQSHKTKLGDLLTQLKEKYLHR